MLGPLTLLVGPNGAGKSNFLDSIRFVAQALDENLDNALRERGGVNEVRRRSTGHPTHFGIDLRFRGRGFEGSYRFQIAAVKGADYRVSHEACSVSGLKPGDVTASYEVRDGVLVQSSEAVMPTASGDRLYLVAASGIDRFRPVFDGLSAMNVYSLAPELMRGLQKPDSGDLLRRDGSNVASVLERLKRQQPQLKHRIEEYLRSIVPGVTLVDRKGLGAWETIEFKQQVVGSGDPWTFPATSMSDGTLRALGVLVALFASSADVYGPIGIEEPEVALHPAAAGMLFDALSSASELRQVLATSHSPDLLDTPALGTGQVLAVRADQGRTLIGRVDAAGSKALADSLFTVGELLRVDQLQPQTQPSEQTALL